MKIYYEILRANITPEVLGKLKKNKIILESTSQKQVKGRYSIVAFESYGSVVLNNDLLKIKTKKQNVEITEKSYEYLKDYINQFNIQITDEKLKHLPFVSGFIGTCSFDLIRHEFPMLKQQSIQEIKDSNDIEFHMIEDVYVFDHYKDELYIIASNLFSDRTKERLKESIERKIEDLKNIHFSVEDINYKSIPRHITTNISEQQFVQTIRSLKKKITEGDMFQVVPSRIYSYKHHFQHNLHQLTFQLYQNLKRQNPSPYMYYINKDMPIVIGSSPESFVKVKDGKVYTNPIAGTIKRGQNKKEDENNEKTLMKDEKELSEHRMLVDLGRNDIHRISKTGTSQITKLMTIERYEHVMHIVSEVIGELKPHLSPMSVIASLLPTGTVSGAPKLRAIQRIYESYPYKRGIYSGGVGYINCNHHLDFALAIRTMIIDEEKVSVEAGCGVVYDSIPEKELEETKLKAKSLLEVTP